MVVKRGYSYAVSALALLLVCVGALVASPGTASAARPPGAPQWALDPDFGDGGIVRTDFPLGVSHYARGQATVVQADGRVVVAGSATSEVNFADVAAVARYLPNGDLDRSFGDGGRVTIGPHATYQVTTAALQDVDGVPKILLAVDTTFRHPLRSRCTIIRLNPDGSLDSDHDADPLVEFGNQGIQVVGFPGREGFCEDMVVQPDGRIVAPVQTGGASAGDVSVFRLLATDGAPDPSFGTDGRVTLPARGYQVPLAVALQPDSSRPARIIVGGLVSVSNGYDWALWRLTSDGAPDSTFGKDGRVVTPMRDQQVQQSFDTIDDLAVTPEGNIVAAGRFRAWPQGERYPQDTAAIAEYLPDGSLDPEFGHGGRAHIPWDARGETEALDVTLDSAGQILYAGPLEMPTSGQFLVGGFTSDGRPDTRFGSTGYQEFSVNGGVDAAEALALDQSGRLVVAGIAGGTGHGLHDVFGVVRLRLQ